jgi:predicted transcriptional regulator YdeE
MVPTASEVPPMTIIKPKIVAKGRMTMVGVEVRTNNRAEANPALAKVPGLWKRYLKEHLADRIEERVDPKATIAAYTNYQSDHMGEYSYLVGAEVKKLGSVPAGMVALRIEPANYVIFESRGPMPQALIDTWGTIWNNFLEASAHRRAYLADFEIHNADTPSQVPIFIGVR